MRIMGLHDFSLEHFHRGTIVKDISGLDDGMPTFDDHGSSAIGDNLLRRCLHLSESGNFPSDQHGRFF
jgi:hypothetical protein